MKNLPLVLLLNLGLWNFSKGVELPHGPLYPNGITHNSDGTLYVGFVASGKILRKLPSKKLWETFFHDERKIYSATSLRLDQKRDLLWGTSPDFLEKRRDAKIFALNTKTREIVDLINVPKGSFGNDIAIGPDGELYITDSYHPKVWIYHPKTKRLDTYVEHPMLSSQKSIGLAGIARKKDGTLFVVKFMDGELLIIDRDRRVSKVKLPRKLENPDGIQLLDENRLILLEGAVKSGNGKILMVSVRRSGKQYHGSIEVISEGLTSPVNLTILRNSLFVTESKIRHRLVSGLEKNIPTSFRVITLSVK